VKKNKIDQVSVDAFSKKLKAWGKTLPKDESGLLELFIDRATSVNVRDLGGYDLTAKVGADAERIFKSLKKVSGRRRRPNVWVDIGPIWLKSVTTRRGE